MKPLKFTTALAAIMALQITVGVAGPASERIAVTVRGTGPDVLLIPGLATSGAVWDSLAGHLQNHFRVHIVQVAGFAGAPAQANASGPVLQPTVDAVDAYIKSHKLSAPSIIGHSLGGLIGGMLAFQYPEDVGSLMIVDSLPFYGALFGAPDSAAVAAQAAAMRDSILAQSQEDYARGEKMFMASLVKSPAGRERAIQWAVASDKSVVARAMSETMTEDIRPRLPEIKIPVTILYPWDAQTGFSTEAADQLYRDSYAALPVKKLVRIDGSFHFIMLDQPEKFAAGVDAFLKK